MSGKFQSNSLFLFLLVIGLISAAGLACASFNIQSKATPTRSVTPVIVEISATPKVIVVTSEGLSPATQTPLVVDRKVLSSIQDSLDLYSEAYNHNDPALLEQAVDQENKPFRRIVRSRFDEYQKSYYAGDTTFMYKVLDAEPQAYGFVLVKIEENDAWIADWTFRRLDDGRWVISEPTVEQIGDMVITETDHFIFETYPWADETNSQLMSLMEEARDIVYEKLGATPVEKALVKIIPIYGLMPFNSMNALATYSTDNGVEQNVIEVYAPHSFAFGFYDPVLGWVHNLRTTLVHEYTHMVHARNYQWSGKLMDWVVEGLAEYVSEDRDYIRWACSAAWSGDLIPIMDTSEAVYKQDLGHIYILEKDVGLAYAEAQALVTYIIEEYGGPEQFWILIAAYDEVQDLDKVLQQTFGVSYDEFNTLWQDWLKVQC